MKAADEARSDVSNAKLSTWTTYSVRRASIARRATSRKRLSELRSRSRCRQRRSIDGLGPVDARQAVEEAGQVRQRRQRALARLEQHVGGFLAQLLHAGRVDRSRSALAIEHAVHHDLVARSKACASSKFTRTVRTRDCRRPVMRPRPRLTILDVVGELHPLPRLRHGDQRDAVARPEAIEHLGGDRHQRTAGAATAGSRDPRPARTGGQRGRSRCR